MIVAGSACSGGGPASGGGAVSGDLSALESAAPAEQPSSAPAPEESESDPEGQTSAPAEQSPANDYQPAADPTPLPADPAVRVGTLDNGLAYYVRHNDKPEATLSVRLVVNAGSVNEPEPGRGAAHFLEHMVFKGTDAYPGDSLESTLRDLGVEMGPDLNAYVGYDETAYLVSVGTDSPETVATAFDVLAEMAHAATLDEAAVVAERGVVLDEIRTGRQSSLGYVSAEFDRIYVEGTPYEGRDPLGAPDAVAAMTAAELRAFYEAWYVPSNMAVVAVGDWPAEGLEALVAEHFGAIPAADPPPFEPVETAPDPEPSFHVVTEGGQGYPYISLDIPIPPARPGTVGGQRLLVMENLIDLMLSNRLDEAYYRGELAQVDRPDLVSFNHNRALRFYGTNWQGDDLASAATGYLSVLLTAAEHGFTAADTERAVEQYAVALQYQLDRAEATESPEYAQLYTAHFLTGADIDTARRRHDRVAALLGETTAAELTAHYRWLMDRAGPIVIAVGPDIFSVPGVGELEAAVAAAAPSDRPSAPAEPRAEELMAAPEPVEPVAARPLAVLDGREGFEWEFANGARVMFAYSDAVSETVDLWTRSLGGWSQLNPGDRALSDAAAGAVLGSGVGDLSKPEFNRLLDQSTASIGAFIGETEEGFSGVSSRGDAETLFQLMHLLVTEPRVDDAAFDEALNQAETSVALVESNTGWQSWVAYNAARFYEAWHRPVATREQLGALTSESLLDLWRRRFGAVDDMVVAVVGDIDASVVEDLARRYVGTLPAGAPDGYADRRLPAPDGVVSRFVGAADDDVSAVFDAYYETEAPVTPSAAVAADVLATVLNDRLWRVVREELGASYTAAVSLDSVLAPRPGFLSEVLVTVGPDRLEEIRSTVLSILDDVATAGPGADELQQARAVLELDYSDVSSNGVWLDVLTSRLHLDDADLLTPSRLLAELEQVDAAAVRDLAAALYGPGNRIEIITAPAPQAASDDDPSLLGFSEQKSSLYAIFLLRKPARWSPAAGREPVAGE